MLNTGILIKLAHMGKYITVTQVMNLSSAKLKQAHLGLRLKERIFIKMRILLLNVTCNSGSTGKIAYALCEQLNQDQHKAIVAYGRRKQKNLKTAVRISSSAEIYFHAISTRITGILGIFSPIATRNFFKAVKRFRPDIVHIHELHGYYINIIPVIKFLKERNIPIVWTFHCEFMYTGKCGFAFECNRWKTTCHNCPKLREYPKSLYFDFTRSMFRHKRSVLSDDINIKIVTPSKWLRERVKHSFLKDKEVLVIQNGIDTENIFYPREVASKKNKMNLKNKRVVLSVAENIMHERKGGKFIIELARRMQDTIFIMIGLNKMIENDLDNLILIGRTSDQNELAEFYSMADLFLICSSSENFPTTCIEALACGTPVAGFDAGGSKETAPDGLGEFVPYGDLDKLQRVIERQLEHINHEKRLLCRNYAREQYSMQRMYEKYLGIYRNLMKETESKR